MLNQIQQNFNIQDSPTDERDYVYENVCGVVRHMYQLEL
jgi:hypothetical protein